MALNAILDLCIFIPLWSLFHFISFKISIVPIFRIPHMFSNSDFIPPLTNQIHTFPEHVLQFIRAQKKTQRAQWAVTVTFVLLNPPTDACSSTLDITTTSDMYKYKNNISLKYLYSIMCFSVMIILTPWCYGNICEILYMKLCKVPIWPNTRGCGST